MRRRWRASALVVAGGLALIALVAAPALGYGEQVFNANLVDGGQTYPVSSVEGAAQSFVPAQSFVLYNVTLLVRNIGGGGQSDPLNVTIQTSAGGAPSGTILAGSDRVGGNGWLDFPFTTRPTLSAGTLYWIVAASAEASGKGYTWTHSNADIVPGYAEQNFVPAGWTVTSNTDLVYVTYGMGLEPRIAAGLTVDRSFAPIGGTYSYTVYLNNTGFDDARTVRVNLTLPAEVSYVSDTATLSGGTKTGPANWTFPALVNGPHAFGVTVRVGGSVTVGSTLTATVHLDYTDSGGVPQPPSTATASILVGIEEKPMYLASDGVPDRTDILRAAAPTGGLGDFDGDGLPGLTFTAGGNAVWVLAPPVARALHFRGPASVVLCLRSLNATETVTLTLTLFDRGATAVQVASVTQAVTVTGGAAYPEFTFDLGVLDHWIARGNVTELTVSEDSGGTIYLAYNAPTYPAAVLVTTDTFVSVDATSVTDAHGTSAFFSPKDAVTILANVSDPFGSSEIAGAFLTLKDPAGTPLATNASIVATVTDPRIPSAWKLFGYPVPGPLLHGRYTFWVNALEGNGVRSATVSGSFDVRAPVLRLDLSANATVVPPLGTVRYTVVLNNTGTGTAFAWLNASLPAGLAYASDNAATVGGVRTGDVQWTFAALAPGTRAFDVVLRVAGDAIGGSHLSLRFDLTYRDEKGFLWGVPGVTSELVVRTASEPLNPLIFVVLAVLIVVPPLAYVLWRRRRGTIEEAFLVLQTGLVLCHLSRRMRVPQDKDHDVLGGMLTAVQSFVRDSFRYGKDRELDKIEFGEYKILIERGKWVYLAIAISGRQHPSLRREMRETIAEVEEKYEMDLKDFGGFVEPLLGARDILARMLRAR